MSAVARLSIAVPADRARLDPRTGAGRVWNTVLAQLARRVMLRTRRASGPPFLARLRRPRPDVWLIPGHEGPLRRPEPVVAVVHGSAWKLDAAIWDLVPRAFAEPFVASTEATLRSASWVITPSEFSRRGLIEGYGFPEERVVAVPHGVDTAVFRPGAGAGRARVAQALGSDRPYVLFASIPSIAQKNLPALRAAMTRLAERGFPHALVIAGGVAGGESPQVLADIGAELPGAPGRVAWLGHVDDDELAGLMAQADAFCLPSLFESFGLTALEALACGAPVVVSNRAALPEVVGDAAVLAEPAPDALEDALARVLSDGELARGLRAAGRVRAEGMTWERTAQGWLEVLRGAADTA